MFYPALTDDVLRETVRVFEACNRNKTKAAEKLGINTSTLTNRLAQAAARSEVPGIQPQPPGLVVEKVSSYYGPEGELRGQWVKSKVDDMEETIEAIKDAFTDLPKAQLPSVSPDFEDDLLTVYNLADLHLALYAWWNETGESYDLDIAEDVVIRTAEELVALTPNADTAVLLNLGDFFHSDNNEHRTRKSGNVLDVDTRFPKVLRVGVRLMVHIISLLVQKHKLVIVRNIAGNHDPYGAIALTAALSAHFHDDPRVIVGDSPDPFWWFVWGKTMIGATHGDMAKFEDLPMVMAGMRPADWGRTEYRYIYCGHIHNKSKWGYEKGGATVETFNSLAAKDAWQHASGYLSNRALQAITLHKETGEKYRTTVPVSGANPYRSKKPSA